VKRRFLLSPEAESDLDEIKQWVVAVGGPQSALYVMRSLLKAVRLLAQHPELGHTREDLTGLPLKFWPVFSYLIVYDPARLPVEIVRVLHGARNLKRLLRERN
jgi:antitoxin ParD1/3/4/toxin ParE1/3/4